MSEQDDLEEVFEAAKFGVTAEQFLESKLGQYIIGCAQKEKEMALQGLQSVDPDNKTEIIRLQARANLPVKMIGWITDAVFNGRNCETIIQQHES